FSFHDTATPDIYTLSLHDALPIFRGNLPAVRTIKYSKYPVRPLADDRAVNHPPPCVGAVFGLRHVNPDIIIVRLKKTEPRSAHRSEEHTSELQSRRDLVCRLLLEK